MTKHTALSNLSDWELVHDDQDIRGWEVHDAAHRKIGRVDDLLVSTDTERVEVIRLDDGKELSARQIELGDGVVYLERGLAQKRAAAGKPVVKVYDDTRVRRRKEHRTADRTTAAAT